MLLAYPTSPGAIDHLIPDDHAILERQSRDLRGRGNRGVPVNQVAFEMALHAGRSNHLAAVCSSGSPVVFAH